MSRGGAALRGLRNDFKLKSDSWASWIKHVPKAGAAREDFHVSLFKEVSYSNRPAETKIITNERDIFYQLSLSASCLFRGF